MVQRAVGEDHREFEQTFGVDVGLVVREQQSVVLSVSDGDGVGECDVVGYSVSKRVRIRVRLDHSHVVGHSLAHGYAVDHILCVVERVRDGVGNKLCVRVRDCLIERERDGLSIWHSLRVEQRVWLEQPLLE